MSSRAEQRWKRHRAFSRMCGAKRLRRMLRHLETSPCKARVPERKKSRRTSPAFFVRRKTTYFFFAAFFFPPFFAAFFFFAPMGLISMMSVERPSDPPVDRWGTTERCSLGWSYAPLSRRRAAHAAQTQQSFYCRTAVEHNRRRALALRRSMLGCVTRLQEDEPRRSSRLRAPRESPRSGSRDFATQSSAESCTHTALQRLE